MNSFNIGDMLVCVSITDGLTKGKKYHVIDIATNMIAIIDNTGGKFYYSEKRFVTVEQQKEKLRKMLVNKREKDTAREKFLSELSFRW